MSTKINNTNTPATQSPLRQRGRQPHDPCGISFQYTKVRAMQSEFAAGGPDRQETIDIIFRRRQPFGDSGHVGNLHALASREVDIIKDVYQKMSHAKDLTNFQLHNLSFSYSQSQIKDEARRLLRAIADYFGTDALITDIDQDFTQLDMLFRPAGVGTQNDGSQIQNLWDLDDWDREIIKIVDNRAREILRSYLSPDVPFLDIAALIAAGERDCHAMIDDGVAIIGDCESNPIYEDVGACAGGFFSLHLGHYFQTELKNQTRWSDVTHRHPLTGYILSTCYFGPCLQFAELLIGSKDGVSLCKRREVISDARQLANQAYQSLQAPAGAGRIDDYLTLGNRNLRKHPVGEVKFLNHGKRVFASVAKHLFDADILSSLSGTIQTQIPSKPSADVVATIALIQMTGLTYDAMDTIYIDRPGEFSFQSQPAQQQKRPDARPPANRLSDVTAEQLISGEYASFSTVNIQDECRPWSISVALKLR